MSKKYYKRIVTFDSDTGFYIVSIPELNIEASSDTETSAMVEARRQVEEYLLETACIIKKLSQDTVEYID